jgi:hypothetical protein
VLRHDTGDLGRIAVGPGLKEIALQRRDQWFEILYLKMARNVTDSRAGPGLGGFHVEPVFFTLQREEVVEERPFRAVKRMRLENGL